MTYISEATRNWYVQLDFFTANVILLLSNSKITSSQGNTTDMQKNVFDFQTIRTTKDQAENLRNILVASFSGIIPSGFLPGIFFRGTEYIVMQISLVMLIFL